MQGTDLVTNQSSFIEVNNTEHISAITTSEITTLLVSDHVRTILQWIFYAVVGQLLDIVGAVANVINAICFIKQGFKDPINVSLLGLAISDLGCLITLIWANIAFTPAFSQLDLPFEPIEVQYLTGSWPHAIFTRISSWITAAITVERCLCITLPFKVKRIVTPKRVTVVVVLIYVILLSSVSPVYYVNRFGWKFSIARNKTIIGLIFTDDRSMIEHISLPINNVLIPLGSFLIVIVCTTILVVTLKVQSKWRKRSAMVDRKADTNSRDQKVTRMIVTISTFFIACNFPLCIIIIALIVFPDLGVDGKHVNAVIVFCSIGFILDSANSTANIFIYYHMSNRYRTVFHEIFCRTYGGMISN